MPFVKSLSEVGTNIRELWSPRIQSTLDLFSSVGNMALGRTPIDPVKAAEATLLSSGFMSGGGGPANIGVLQKRLLKQTAKAIKERRFKKGIGKSGISDTRSRDILKSVHKIPEIAAQNIDTISILPRKQGNIGSAAYDSLRINLNPRFDRNIYGIPPQIPQKTGIHEATHLGQVFGFRFPKNPVLEKQTNFRSGILENLIKRSGRELSADNKRMLYRGLPQEIHARAVADATDNLMKKAIKGPDKYGIRSNIADEIYLKSFNKEADKVIKGLKKTAPKLYKKAIKHTNKRMKDTYGKQWNKGLTGFRKVLPST